MARFCPECGTARDGDASTCANCGYVFSSDAVPETEAPSPATEPAATTVMPTEGGAETGQAQPVAAAAPSSSPARRRALLGAGAAAALVVAGAGLWWTGTIDIPGLPGRSGEGAGGDLDFSLMPIAFGERCGFVDSDGRMVINPQFDSASFFSRASGLAPVLMGGKWGLIDREGQFVVNPQYDGIMPVEGGRFVARIGDRYGIIDGSGAFIVNPQFDMIGPFDADGRAYAGTGGRHGLIDRRGNFVVSPQFDEIASDMGPNGEVRYFVDGLAAARSGDRWGYIDHEGNWVVTPQFASAGTFGENGLAAVQVMGGGPQPPAAQPAAAPGSPAAAAVPAETVPPPPPSGPPRTVTIPGGETAVLPPNIVVPLDPQGNLIMNNGDSITVSNGVVTGFTPGPGTVIPSAAGSSPKPGSSQGNWGYVDRRGRLVIPARFSSAGSFSGAGLAPIELDGRFGYVDRAGSIRINPQFGAARDFVSGPGGWIAAVAVDPQPGQPGGARRRWGLINQTGAFRAQPQFDDLGDFDSNGRSVARVGENVGLVDETGRFVVQPIYASLILLPGARNYLYTKSGGVTTGANVLEIGWLDRGGRVLSTARGGLCGGSPMPA